MTPKLKVALDALAEACVIDLFTNGEGRQADRLALMAGKRDLGSWGRPAVKDYILEYMQRAIDAEKAIAGGAK